jgi:iron complex transport system permease protein
MGSERLDSRRFWKAIALSVAALAVVLLTMPLVGSAKMDLARVLAGQSPDWELMVELRLPRVLLAVLAGGGLALAGALFQGLLREALATPYTLGVSSGASLGAVTAICFGWREVAHMPAVWMGAFIGAGMVLLLVLGIAGQGRRVSTFTLLLAGVAMNSVCGALIQFLHSMAGLAQSFSISRWLMGGIDAVDYGTLGWLAVLVIGSSALAMWRWRDWNLMAGGEEWAAARGVSVRRAVLAGYIAGSLLTGAITAVTGPIGFVGLIVPHGLRLWVGADHRLLLPCSFLAGGAFLALCDGVGRVVLAPAEAPVGVVTAILGGPFFIWLLRSRSRSVRI